MTESTFPKTWAGFRAFLDEQYPEDVFPDDDRDLGPAFVVAARRLAAAEVRLEAVKAAFGWRLRPDAPVPIWVQRAAAALSVPEGRQPCGRGICCKMDGHGGPCSY